MQIHHQYSLKDYNTFGIDVKAQTFGKVNTIKDLKEVLKKQSHHEVFILGGGSNMLLTKNIDQLVLHINLKGIEVLSETDDKVKVKVMAGENWHEFVLWTLNKNYGGVENLALIPGNVGTAPIQNIGAYGVELKDVFVSCEAVHIPTQNTKTFYYKDCAFGYRESVFKQALKGQYIITSITLELYKAPHHLHLEYGAIKSELEKQQITNASITDVANAVISIRQQKLPDPKEIGNSGSFFKNPVIPLNQYQSLKENFEDVPCYPVDKDHVKVPAGWLIEKAGFKGKRFKNYGVHKKQALVLVNYGGAKGEDIYKLAQLIQETVLRLFHIQIETEVNII